MVTALMIAKWPRLKASDWRTPTNNDLFTLINNYFGDIRHTDWFKGNQLSKLFTPFQVNLKKPFTINHLKIGMNNALFFKCDSGHIKTIQHFCHSCAAWNTGQILRVYTMKIMLKGLLAIASIGLTAPVMAGLMLQEHQIEGNDCAGYFSIDGGACQIFGIGDEGEKVMLSPVIAKYEFDESENDTLVRQEEKTEINDGYSSFSGDELSVNFDNKASGTWSYSPGEDDPGIRYWVAKGSNYFNLFWYVDSDGVDGNCNTIDGSFTLECLSLAEYVTSGTWETPNDSGLSHFTVYNGEPPRLVPEPGTAALLASGIIGLILSRRRVRQA